MQRASGDSSSSTQQQTALSSQQAPRQSAGARLNPSRRKGAGSAADDLRPAELPMPSSGMAEFSSTTQQEQAHELGSALSTPVSGVRWQDGRWRNSSLAGTLQTATAEQQVRSICAHKTAANDMWSTHDYQTTPSLTQSTSGSVPQRRRLAEKDPHDHTRLPSFGHPCLHKGYSAVYRRQDRSINRDDSSVTLVGRCVSMCQADNAPAWD